jgi:hypothetical protein
LRSPRRGWRAVGQPGSTASTPPAPTPTSRRERSRPLSGRTLAVLLAIAALAAGLALRCGRAPPDDETAIRALFEDAARAAAERRVGDTVAQGSERFAGHGLDRRGVKQRVAFHVLRGEWVSVSISGARIAVAGDAARANVDAVLARGAGGGKALAALLPGEASAHRFACRLAREEDGWRVVAAEWRPIELADALGGPPDPLPPGHGAGGAGAPPGR